MQNLFGHDFLRFRPLWLAIGWALVLSIVYLSLTPQPVSIPVEHGDKMGHVAAYAALMLWFMQLYSGVTARILLAGSFVAMGVGLEFAQLLTATRTFEIADMVADTTGVAIGWIFAPPRIPNILRRLEAIMLSRQF